jgi:hypothetical protein
LSCGFWGCGGGGSRRSERARGRKAVRSPFSLKKNESPPPKSELTLDNEALVIMRGRRPRALERRRAARQRAAQEAWRGCCCCWRWRRGGAVAAARLGLGALGPAQSPPEGRAQDGRGRPAAVEELERAGRRWVLRRLLLGLLWERRGGALARWGRRHRLVLLFKGAEPFYSGKTLERRGQREELRLFISFVGVFGF